jgi:hypothetical protein
MHLVLSAFTSRSVFLLACNRALCPFFSTFVFTHIDNIKSTA